MPVVRVPALLKYYLDQHTEIDVPGATVTDVLSAVCAQYPRIYTHLFDDKGQLRRHINLFVNQDNIRDLNGLDSAVGAQDVVKILPAVTGG